MNDLLVVFFTIFIVTGMIYFMYKVMLGTEKQNDEELQITSQELLEQLNILHRQKKYNIVDSLAKKYLAKKSSDDEIRAVYAKTLYDMDRIFDAVEHAKIVVKHKPSNFDMKIFLANCYVEIDKPMKAINLLQEIIDVDSENIVAVKELAKLYYDTNQKLSAIKMYKKLEEYLESNIEKAKTKAMVAEMYLSFRDFEPAIKEYEGILEIYPDDIKVRKRLIELYRLTNNDEAFIEKANELLNSANQNDVLWALQMLMEIYRVNKDFVKAIEFANLIKAHPLADSIEAEENVARIFYDEGRLDNAIEILDGLIEKDPDNIDLKKFLAKTYEQVKNFEMASFIYKRILDNARAQDIEQVHIEISDLYANWAMHLFLSGDNDECFKHFMIAIKHAPLNPDVYYRLGNVNKLIKNYNEAISQFRRAIEIDDQNPDYYFALAECYEGIDSVYEQKKYLIEYLKLDAENSYVHYKLGMIFDSQGDPTSAIYHIKKAIDLDEKYIEPRYKLALMLEHKGDLETAIEMYEEILRLNPGHAEAINNLKMLKS